MKIHLLAIDLDGTLLNSAKQITRTTEAMLRAAREAAGTKVVLASARPPRSVLPFHRRLDLDTPMINYNGALVYDPLAKRVLMHRPIPLDNARAIVAMARARYPGVLVSAEVLDRWFTDRYDETYQTETAKHCKPDQVGPMDQWLTGEVTKLLLLGEAPRMSELADELMKRFLHQISMVRTEDWMLQIMHATVSKAQALKVVAAELGVSREHVMAIGDNANDVGMLQWAGIGVAMANASPDAIAAADYVTDHHDADGAAKAIHKLIIEGLPHSR